MTTRIFKSFLFDAAHQLNGSEIHGHTYEVTIYLRGLVAGGYVLREEIFEREIQKIKAKLDHKYLNDIMSTPTSEFIAEKVYGWAVELLEYPALHVDRVTVYRESCRLGAEFTRDEF